MTKHLARNDEGRFQKDDASLRDGMIETLGIVRELLLYVELQHAHTAEEADDAVNAMHERIEDLIRELSGIDRRKGDWS